MKYGIAIAALLAIVLTGAAPASTNKPRAAGQENGKAVRHDPAFRKGYDDGYRAGARDSEALKSTYNDQSGPLYEKASDGYTQQYGDQAKYQKIFREGYVAGYKAGWDFNSGRYIPFGGGSGP